MPCHRKGNGPIQKLPRVIKKGGVEVLDTVPLSEDTVYKVEAILLPNFASGSNTAVYQSRGAPYTFTDTLDAGSSLCYTLAVVNLPEIPEALCDDTLLVWEAFRVETELIFTPQVGSAGYIRAQGTPAGVEGSQMYFWACGGSPLDVIGINPDPERMNVAAGLEGPSKENQPSVAGIKATRKQVTAANFPIEIWSADPTRNENCRYFGRIVGGSVTPPVVSFGNQSTTPLVDENGVGILCLFGAIYLTSADMLGMVGYAGNPTLSDAYSQQRSVQAAMGRFFRVHFRQRRVKHPYTVDMMFRQFLQPQKPQVQGTQPNAVQEVVMEQMQPSILPTTLEGAIGYSPSTKFILQNGELIYPSSTVAAGAANLFGPPVEKQTSKEPSKGEL